MGYKADESLGYSSHNTMETLLRLTRPAMACEFEIILIGENRDYLRDVANAAFDEVESLDNQLNCFNPQSEVAFLNSEAAHRAVVVESGLFELLTLARKVWEDTGGAFDVTAGPVIELWREAERVGREPEKQAVDAALSKTGMCHIQLDEQTNAVRFDTEGVSINLGAIGKGYAVRRVADMLQEYGIRSFLVSAGKSTLYASGDGPGGNGWDVGIRHPEKIDERITSVNLRDSAMSTSGGIAQRDEVVEERFEHIIDPVSGMQTQPSCISVSVITKDPALSDALSTAFYLRGRGFAENYCREHTGIGTIFVERREADYSVITGES